MMMGFGRGRGGGVGGGVGASNQTSVVDSIRVLAAVLR